MPRSLSPSSGRSAPAGRGDPRLRLRLVDRTLGVAMAQGLGLAYDGHRTDCMRGISVDRVATAVLERARG